MNILYYTWGEITCEDVVDTLIKMGHEVEVVSYQLSSYTVHPEFIGYIEDKMHKKHYDCLFSMNYLPLLSKISLRNHLPYISWIFDSPCIALYTDMVFNPYNYVFHFDLSEVHRFQKLGVKNIWHMPLAVNTTRVQQLLEKCTTPDPKLVNSEVAFMGNLYNNDFDFFDQIKHMPEYDKGYLDGVMDAQMLFFGSDLIGEAVPESMTDRMSEYATVKLEDEFFAKRRDVLLGMIRKKTTVRERKEIMQMLASRFHATLYSPSDSSMIPELENRGYLNYRTEMPVMFANTAVNLNITLRTIESGISLRVLDVLGAGGFLLTNYQAEIPMFFTNGEDLVMYESREDLVDKIKYYLEHEEERKQIAKNGQKKIQEHFTYDKQLRRIMNQVFGPGTDQCEEGRKLVGDA